MKILIAEDDRTSRWALQGILMKAGYEVLAATNGEEAWQVMQLEDPQGPGIPRFELHLYYFSYQQAAKRGS